jgi:hypothetical protein
MVSLGSAYSYLQDFITLSQQLDRTEFARRVGVPVLVAETRPKPMLFGGGATRTTREQIPAPFPPNVIAVGDKLPVFSLRPKSAEDGQPVSLGRTTDNDLVVSDDTVSSQHALLRQDLESGQVSLIDLGSSNGTLVNDLQLEPMRPVLLKDGDLIAFGDATFKFYTAGGLHDALRQSLPGT